MENRLCKAIARSGNIRVIACETTNLVEKARQLHDCWPTASAALGRVLTMAAMMGSMEKNPDQKIAIQINGGGAIGSILAEGWGNGNVRGFVADPHQYLKYNDSNKLAVGLVVGTDGYLKVSKNMGLKENFTSQVELQTGEIGDDFAYYFAVSEQIPTAVSVGVLVETDYSIKSAGGLIIQMLPGATEEDIVAAEQAVSRLRPISTMISEGMSIEDILKQCFDDVEILEEKPLQWNCGCNRDRFYGALSTLKTEELVQIRDEDHGAHIRCEYCNSEYDFNEREINTIIDFKASCGR